MSTPSATKWKRFGAVLACGLTLAAGRAVYVRSIAPLLLQETEILGEVGDLKGRIAGARQTLAETLAQEEDIEQARGELMRMKDDRPAGAAEVWVPGLVQPYLRRFGFEKLVTRKNTALKEPHLPGYERIYWCLSVPLQSVPNELTNLLTAIADLEQAEPSVRVVDLVIRPDPDDSSARTAGLTFSTLLRED